jgi:putative ABC transport system permease protein
MNPRSLAWRSLTRQPARAWLGIAGIAVVGALLFDMLLLSRGLAVSFRGLLDDVGFEVRVTANRAYPARGPRIKDSQQVLRTVLALPEVAEAVAIRFGRAVVPEPAGGEVQVNFMGVGGPARGTWTLLEGRDLFEAQVAGAAPPILVNRRLADLLRLAPGDGLRLRGACRSEDSALPLSEFRVAGIVAFRFEVAGESTTVTTLSEMMRACEVSDPNIADFLLVASAEGSGPQATVSAIRGALPDLFTFSNEEFVDRLQATDFSYFRQISFALSTITLFFAFLLIATLLTVSINQRLGEVAALRALGFRRARVVAGLLWESVLLVACGGALALPLGGLLALRLDAILRTMPGIPADLHFFVFQPRALLVYVALLAVTGVLAAAYPLWLAARLPIAATLRREVVS